MREYSPEVCCCVCADLCMVWCKIEHGRGGELTTPYSLSSHPSPSPSLPLASSSLLPPSSIPSLSSARLHSISLPSSHPSPSPSLHPLFSPLLFPSLSPPVAFPYHPRCSTFPCTSLPSPVTFLQMEAQWELVKSFEDFLSEVEKSLEDLLPVEADLPKLERQRSTIEVRAVCDGREKEV